MKMKRGREQKPMPENDSLSHAPSSRAGNPRFSCHIGIHRLYWDYITMKVVCLNCLRIWDGVDAAGNPCNEINASDSTSAAQDARPAGGPKDAA